jgi:hypothetical protein
MTTQNNSYHLLNYLIAQANSGAKNWFGYHQQRICGIDFAYQFAIAHGDKFTPDEIAEYAYKLNNSIFDKLVKND